MKLKKKATFSIYKRIQHLNKLYDAINHIQWQLLIKIILHSLAWLLICEKLKEWTKSRNGRDIIIIANGTMAWEN